VKTVKEWVMTDDALTVEQLKEELRQIRDLYEAIHHENAGLRQQQEVDRAEIERRRQVLAETLEQQMTTAEMLRVIASSPNDPQSVLDALVVSAARLCGADIASVQRLDSDEAVRLAATGRQSPERCPVAGTVTERVVAEARTIQIHGSPEAQLADDSDSLGPRLGLGAQLSAPVIRGGRVIGVLGLNRFEPRPFSDAEIALLEVFADQAAIVVENAELVKALQDRVGELQALGEVARAVSYSFNIHEVLSTIVQSATRLSDSDGGSLYEYDEITETLLPSGSLPRFVPDDVDEDLTNTIRSRCIRLGEGAVGRAVSTRGPVEIPDILVPGSYESAARDALVEAGFRSLLALPVMRQDRPFGALVVVRRTPGQFSSNVVALLQTFAGQCALAIDNARLQAALEMQGRALERDRPARA
jgi:two-component system, NtrC family, sensor kinase